VALSNNDPLIKVIFVASSRKELDKNSHTPGWCKTEMRLVKRWTKEGSLGPT